MLCLVGAALIYVRGRFEGIRCESGTAPQR
jgi:hypothetical protein